MAHFQCGRIRTSSATNAHGKVRRTRTIDAQSGLERAHSVSCSEESGRGSALVDGQRSRLEGMRDRFDRIEMTRYYIAREGGDRQAVSQGREQAAQFAWIDGTVRFVMLLRELRYSVRRKMRSTDLLGKNQQQRQQQV
jgi:hypothetical protein